MILQKEDLAAALEAIARDVVQKCTFRKHAGYGDLAVLQPGGDGGYPAFWVRDAAMMMQSGLVPESVMRACIHAVASAGQNGNETRRMQNGLFAPPYSVCDHVTDAGRPVFFPGTYEDGTDQGNGTFGFSPPMDDNEFFVMMAGTYVRVTGNVPILREDFGGMTLLDRVARAHAATPTDPATGLCVTDEEGRSIDFGFHDCIVKTGKLFASSLLHRMGAETLAFLYRAVGDEAAAKRYDGERASLDRAIADTFYDDETGWCFSATGLCHQHDVWGTAVAAYVGVIRGERLAKTARALLDGYRKETTVKFGAVRQVPEGENFSESTMWERAHCPLDDYQNGAYWHTPSGMYAAVMAEADPAAAEAMLWDYVRHTEAHFGEMAPFEWVNRRGDKVGVRYYGTSATGAYAAVCPLIY